MNPITGLLVALSALTAVFVGGWSRMLPSSKERPGFPNLLQIGVGAFTNFFDTLGIGSYATSTTLFRFFQLVDDRIIPGTLNVGHALPTVVQTFIYTSIIPVDVHFMLGALMTLGIGLYAPCMILVSLLGMNPKAAFPIMMGSCAFLMPVGGLRFIREQSYSLRAAFGLALGGIPGVLLAAYIVKELPLDAVRWLVIAVVIYTALSMLSNSLLAGEGAEREPDRVKPQEKPQPRAQTG